MKKYYSLFIALAAVLFLGVQISNAQSDQTGSGLSISPLINDPVLELDPGESATLNYTIRNVTSQPIEAVGTVNNFEADGETGQPKLILDNNAEVERGITDFISELPTLELESLEAQEITVTVTVPTNAVPGSHYGIIRYTSSGADQEDSNVLLSASVSSIVVVEVSGDIQEGMSLVEFGVSKPGGTDARKLITESSAEVFLRLENTGNNFAEPIGKVKVSNMFGSEVVNQEFNEDRGKVLPDTSRRFSFAVADLAPGRYTVEASVAPSSGGGDIINSSTSFWVIPVWLLIVLLVLLVAVIGGFMAYRAIRGNRIIMVPRKRRKAKK